MSSLRRFIFRLSSLLFHCLLLFLIQPGCRIQFTPGDGICGNGVLEDDEMCDGSDFGGKTCSDWSSYEHGELLCTEDCKVDLTMCHTCGNGRVEGPEDCDGENLDGETCDSLGAKAGGDLSCRADCSFDLTGCKEICGNGVREEGEECDGEDLGGATCESVDPIYHGGTLACEADCLSFDTSLCEWCGDGIRNGNEQCDGADWGNVNGCANLPGFDSGTLVCGSDCTFDTTGCGTCGDNVINGDEVCDGEDLGGETCQTQGFYEGTLACLSNCMGFDKSGCSGYCGDWRVNGDEVCDGNDLRGETCQTQGFYGGTLACLSDCSDFDKSGCIGYCGDGEINGEEICDTDDFGGLTCESYGFNSGNLLCLANCTTISTSDCFTDPLLVTWISVPGGTFDMGSDGHSSEQPVHSVTVPSFEMTKSHVTVEQYEMCVADGACSAPATSSDRCNWDNPGYEDHPVNCISWHRLRNFCEWIGGRLPTEAEWEYAARSGGQDIIYPWGNDIATCEYAVMKEDGLDGCGTERTWPVCSKVAGNTDHGLCDMVGNAWHWVEDDWHADYNGAPNDGSAWIDEPRGSSRVIRGSSYLSSANGLRATNRYHIISGGHWHAAGGRCAR